MLDSVLKFINAMERHRRSGLSLLDENYQYDRLNICQNCDLRSGQFCSLCGCMLKIKAKFPLETCPSGFWPNVAESGHLTESIPEIMQPNIVVGGCCGH